MKTIYRATIAAFVGGIAMTGAASAETIVFGQAASTTDNPVIDTAPTVTVDDDTAGFLTFVIDIPNDNGELSGVFIDFAGDPSFASTDVASLTGGVSITDFAEDVNDVGNGRNLQGNYGDPVNGPSGVFDIAFGLDDGENGGAGRQVALPFSFTVDDLDTLTLANIMRIALRFQSVGDLGEDGLGGGSEKIILFENDLAVPLPAAVWLMGAGIAGLGFAGRRKTSA